jgi:hypothetical protein
MLAGATLDLLKGSQRYNKYQNWHQEGHMNQIRRSLRLELLDQRIAGLYSRTSPIFPGFTIHNCQTALETWIARLTLTLDLH